MVIKSEQIYIDEKNCVKPLWQLDTTNYIVTHYNEDTHESEITHFNAECVRYHIDSICTKNADILRDMVCKGEILDYLNEFEEKVNEMIDRQVERWKKSDKDYLEAKELGHNDKEAGILNMLTLQAKEIIYRNVVYI